MIICEIHHTTIKLKTELKVIKTEIRRYKKNKFIKVNSAACILIYVHSSICLQENSIQDYLTFSNFLIIFKEIK